MTVRRARPEDADVLGEVHVAAWRAAYRGTIPDTYLDALDPAQRAEQWRERLANPATNCLVALDGDGALCGFALFGAGEAEGEGQLYAINLEPTSWGLGLGRDLIKAASNALAELGHREAILYVVDANARARRFYEIAGWSWDGGVREETFGDGVVRELRYRRPLPVT